MKKGLDKREGRQYTLGRLTEFPVSLEEEREMAKYFSISMDPAEDMGDKSNRVIVSPNLVEVIVYLDMDTNKLTGYVIDRRGA